MCMPKAPKMPEMPAPPPAMQEQKAPDIQANRRRPGQNNTGIAGGTLLTGPMGGMGGANIGGSTLLGG